MQIIASLGLGPAGTSALHFDCGRPSRIVYPLGLRAASLRPRMRGSTRSRPTRLPFSRFVELALRRRGRRAIGRIGLVLAVPRGDRAGRQPAL